MGAKGCARCAILRLQQTERMTQNSQERQLLFGEDHAEEYLRAPHDFFHSQKYWVANHYGDMVKGWEAGKANEWGSTSLFLLHFGWGMSMLPHLLVKTEENKVSFEAEEVRFRASRRMRVFKPAAKPVKGTACQLELDFKS